MKMKRKIPKRRDPIAYDLLTNGLYKPKVIKNKKKQIKKFNWRKEISSYLSTLVNKIF